MLQPAIHQSSLDYLNMLVQEENDNGVGIPFGNWLQITAWPGVGKTTMGLQIAKSFCPNPNIIIHHYDFEMGEHRARKLYRALELTDNDIDYHYEPFETGDELLDHIFKIAESLLEQGKSFIAIIDSNDFLYPRGNYAKQVDVARRIKAARNKYPNLLLISIAHMVKSGKIAGPAEYVRYSDIILNLHKKNGYVYLTTEKNRNPAPDAPDVIKLFLDVKTREFRISSEPDWISEMPAVQFLKRNVGKLFKRNE